MCLCPTQCRSSLPANLIEASPDDHGDNAGEAGILVGETDPIAGEGDPAVGEAGFPAGVVRSTTGSLMWFGTDYTAAVRAACHY